MFKSRVAECIKALLEKNEERFKANLNRLKPKDRLLLMVSLAELLKEN